MSQFADADRGSWFRRGSIWLGATTFPYGLGVFIGSLLLGGSLARSVTAGCVVWAVVSGARVLSRRDEEKYGRDDPYDG